MIARTTTFAVLFILGFGSCAVATDAHADTTPSPQVTATRDAFATCARANLKALEEVEGVTATGLAFFVGLSCAKAREDYRSALTASGTDDVARMMQAIDAHMIDFILRDWASKNQK